MHASHRLNQQWDRSTTPPFQWQDDLYFKNPCGRKVHYGYAPPSQGPVRGTVVMTFGYNEHALLYYETIKRYQKLGFEVFAMDWSGQGRSDRNSAEGTLKAFTKSLDDNVRDLEQFVTTIVQKRRRAPGAPLIMSTNSMGGHFGLLYLQKNPDMFDAAIMSTPMFSIQIPGLPFAMRHMASNAFNLAACGGLKNVHPIPRWERPVKLEKDQHGQPAPPNIRRMMNMLQRRGYFRYEIEEPTVGWIASAFRSTLPTMEPGFLASVKTPVLIGSAGRETLVSNAAHRHAARHLPEGRLCYFRNADHNLWFERDEAYEIWWQEIEKFLQEYEILTPKTDPQSVNRSRNCRPD